jgi:hypothetical protein
MPVDISLDKPVFSIEELIEKLKRIRDRLMKETEALLSEVTSFSEVKLKAATHEENQSSSESSS